MFKTMLAALFFVAASAFAAYDSVQTFDGILHNNKNEHRATLETSEGRFVLDYQGSDLYHIGERYDRVTARVTGNVISAGYARHPVLRVHSITFSPRGSRSVTYRVGAQTSYYTRFERPEYRSDFSRDDRAGHYDTDNDGYPDRHDREYKPYPQRHVDDYRYSRSDKELLLKYRD